MGRENTVVEPDTVFLVEQEGQQQIASLRMPRWRPMISIFLLLCLLGLVCIHESESRLSLRVALCAGGILSREVSRPSQLVAHRGCEWPYPENTLPALLHGATLLNFVELDVTLTKDGEVVAMHDETLDRTTNGTGFVCSFSLSQLRQLSVKHPTAEPSGLYPEATAVPCEESSSPDSGMAGCHYRIPTLDAVFQYLPLGTRFMIDVKVCHINGTTSSSVAAVPCNSCDRLVVRVGELMRKHTIRESQVVFTSTDSHSLQSFAEKFRSASYALSIDHHYVHYTTKQLVTVLDRGDFDAVAMYYGTAGIRPDLVRAARTSKSLRTQRNREVYAWTIRKTSNARVALCSGAESFIVADPELWASHALLRSAEHACSSNLSDETNTFT